MFGNVLCLGKGCHSYVCSQGSHATQVSGQRSSYFLIQTTGFSFAGRVMCLESHK